MNSKLSIPFARFLKSLIKEPADFKLHKKNRGDSPEQFNLILEGFKMMREKGIPLQRVFILSKTISSRISSNI